MLHLFSATEHCFARELEACEKARIRLKYSSVCPPDEAMDGEVVRDDILHHNWMELLAENSLGPDGDLFKQMMEGKHMTQIRRCAEIQGVDQAALRGIETGLQHELVVRA